MLLKSRKPWLVISLLALIALTVLVSDAILEAPAGVEPVTTTGISTAADPSAPTTVVAIPKEAAVVERGPANTGLEGDASAPASPSRGALEQAGLEELLTRHLLKAVANHAALAPEDAPYFPIFGTLAAFENDVQRLASSKGREIAAYIDHYSDLRERYIDIVVHLLNTYEVEVSNLARSATLELSSGVDTEDSISEVFGLHSATGGGKSLTVQVTADSAPAVALLVGDARRVGQEIVDRCVRIGFVRLTD